MDFGRIFGRGISFPPRVGPDGRIAWSEGPENVREAIRVILLTRPGERQMLPEFGANLQASLFEPNTVATRRLIQEQILRSLKRWEPRVSVQTVTVDEDPAEARGALASVEYTLVASQAADRMSLRLPLTA